jgi:nucleoside-diphosphate-sugar epimerase
MKKIFITGGAGYCGSRLVPFLLKKKFKITVYDILYFGKKFLPKHKNLKIIKGDIRDTKHLEKTCKDHDIFINLSCISNDASFELDKNLSKTINLDAFEPMVKIAKKNGIKRFIYASSSSVYGLSKKRNVKENHPLVPLTLYNKYKGMCEPKLFKHTDENFTGIVFRPATVCGFAPRLRLDLSVNILTTHAYFNNKILVFGGKQLRPNLHVQDYCDALLKLIKTDKKLVQNEIFNVGYQNMSILNIAKKVKKIVEKKLKKKISLQIVKSNDNRSYHINSDKIKDKIKFKPKYSIDYAVNELCDEFKKNKIKNVFKNNVYYNVKTLMKINAK